MLNARLFSRLQVDIAGHAAPIRLAPGPEALLAYLLLHRRPHPREHLMDVFWGNATAERGSASLSTAMWHIRRHLEPPGTPGGTYLTIPRAGDVGFKPSSAVKSDVDHFESDVTSTLNTAVEDMRPPDAERLAAALSLYSGELLEGMYHDWLLLDRERLRLLFIDGMYVLMRYNYYHGRIEEALRCGNRILAHDPLREAVHREMMRMHVANGQRALAMRQYQTCRDMLAAELGIEPMVETQALHAHIRSQDSPELSPSHLSTAPQATMALMIEELEQAHAAVLRLGADLDTAIRMLRRGLPSTP